MTVRFSPLPSRLSASYLSALMMVSADAGPDLRRDAAAGRRPCPDFLRLEERHGVRLLDWSSLGIHGGHRSPSRSLRHVGAALSRRDEFDVIVSDGEHVGIPFAFAKGVRRIGTPHLVIGHHLVTRAKTPLFRRLRADRWMDRILVHSPHQVELITGRLGVPAARVHVLPFAVDTDYWAPSVLEEQDDLVVAVGSEHRDHLTLARACPEPLQVFIVDNSPYSPEAQRDAPARWPANVERRGLSWAELRHLYSRAGVVVVPLIPNDFSAGVTAALEAMSMGKALVVSGTRGLSGVVEHGRTGVVVPPGDMGALRDAVASLLADPAERRRLGDEARRVAVGRHGLDGYTDALARHIGDLAGSRGHGTA